MFQPQTMAYCVVSVTPSADPQRSRLHINNIETRTAINYIMAPDEYQALLWDPQLIWMGLLLKQLRECTTLDISNIRPLKVKRG